MIKRARKKSIKKNDEVVVGGAMFLSAFALFALILLTAISLGVFFYKFIAEEVDAEMRRTVNIAADNYKINGEPSAIYHVSASAYSSRPAETDSTPCITATGFDVCLNYAIYGSANTVASNFLPLHSIVKIPELYGDKLFVVRDRMNSRYGSKNIDLWMPTYFEAAGFGRKQVRIEVY